MGAEESRPKRENLSSSSDAIDQSLEVKEEVTAIVTRKLKEFGKETNIHNEKLCNLETSFAKLRVENCNLKYQLSFLSEKVVTLEKHDVHFINVIRDTISLELLEKIRCLEDRLKKLESPDISSQEQHLDQVTTETQLHTKSRESTSSTSEANKADHLKSQIKLKSLDNFESKNDTAKEGEDLDDFLMYEEDPVNLSEVTIDLEIGRFVVNKRDTSQGDADEKEVGFDQENISAESATKMSDDIHVAEDGNMLATDLECLIKRLFKRHREVNTGNLSLKDTNSKLDNNPELSEAENNFCKDAAVQIHLNKEQVSKLMVEDMLVKLDREINNSLNGSNPQISKCSELLKEVLSLEVTPLMLKKQPSVLLTMGKLRNYVGAVGPYDQDRKEMVKLMNTRSEACFSKFLKLFPRFDLTGERGFFVYFQEQVDMFRSKTKTYDEMKVISLTDEDSLDLC